jgi:hypothetical protein
MAQFDQNKRVWFIESGDLAYWVDDDGNAARCKVELITDEWIYVRFTADEFGRKVGGAARQHRCEVQNRRIAPRDAVRFKVTSTGRVKSPIKWKTILVGEPSLAA